MVYDEAVAVTVTVANDVDVDVFTDVRFLFNQFWERIAICVGI